MAFKRDDIFPAVAASALFLLLVVIIGVALGLMWAEEKTAAILTAIADSPYTMIVAKVCVTWVLLCLVIAVILIVKDAFFDGD